MRFKCRSSELPRPLQMHAMPYQFECWINKIFFLCVDRIVVLCSVLFSCEGHVNLTFLKDDSLSAKTSYQKAIFLKTFYSVAGSNSCAHLPYKMNNNNWHGVNALERMDWNDYTSPYLNIHVSSDSSVCTLITHYEISSQAQVSW